MKQAIDYIETDKRVTKEILGGDNRPKISSTDSINYPHGCHAWLTFKMSNRERKMNWVITNRIACEYLYAHKFDDPIKTWLYMRSNKN